MSPVQEGVQGSHFSEPLSTFYIPTTADGGERGFLTLKQGDCFAVLDSQGAIRPHKGKSVLGVFYNDTRHLSGLDMVVEGREPLLLSSSITDDNVLLRVDLANPDIYKDGDMVLSRETLHIVRSVFLWENALHHDVSFQNFDLNPHRARILFRFEADFCDLFEIRGVARARRGRNGKTSRDESGVMFRYHGLDHDRHTRVRLSPLPNELTDNYAAYDIVLAPHEHRTICLTAEFAGEQQRNSKPISRLIAAKRFAQRRATRSASLHSSNGLFNRFASRSISDLHMLITETPQGPYPCAGIPWFSTQFGRDGLVVGLQTLWANPDIARGVLGYLAATQAKDDDPARDAEPGKILHEARRSEMALTGEVPFGRYYGSVDSTPLFVVLAGEYFRRTADIATVRQIWPNITAALEWIDGPGDRDHDGFVEYRARSQGGLSNQGWKDSSDSVMHEDGRLADGPIALCEVQAYVYLAKQLASTMGRALGHERLAIKLLQEAAELRDRFEARFWCEDLGTYALALDGEKNPCRVRSSNAGHALFGGIASAERARRVAAGLMQKNSFSGWGVRTLAQDQRRYNPMSYHNGSIWPHDNSLIALGLARYKLKDPVLSIFSAIFEVVHYFNDQRLPELFCGFSRRLGQAPTRYPVACSPQAWASASILALIHASLGLEIDPVRREVVLNSPVLPPGLETLTLRDLWIGENRVSLRIERHGDGVAIDTIGPAPNISIVLVP